MYEEAAACEDKDVEEVKSAHLTASFLPKLKSDRCFLPFSRLTRDIFRRSFWRGHFYLFRVWHTWNSRCDNLSQGILPKLIFAARFLLFWDLTLWIYQFTGCQGAKCLLHLTAWKLLFLHLTRTFSLFPHFLIRACSKSNKPSETG